MSRTHETPRPVRRTVVLAMSFALLLGLGAAVPVAADRPSGDDPRSSWAAPLGHLGELLGRLFGSEKGRAGLEAEGDDGPDMDPDGLQAEGDHGPGMDPDGLQADGDDGPGMDPDGLEADADDGPGMDPNG